MPVAEPIDFEVIKNAVHEWFSNSTGLQVVWQNQSAPRPATPFGTLSILSGPTPLSQDWEEREIVHILGNEGETIENDGEEIEIQSTVPCQFSISCQTFVGCEDGRDPTADAISFANKALAALGLQSYRDIFSNVNASVVRTSGVKNIGALLDSQFESRAAFDVTFGSVLCLSELTGYIERVHATSTELRIDRDFGVGEEI